MLSHGPIALAPFVPYFEDMLDDPSWRFRVRIDDAVLRWGGWQKKLDLRVIGARFVGREGTGLISVPSLSIALDSRALLAGQFRVTGLELIEPRLRLLRHEDGRIEITNAANSAQTEVGHGFTFEPGALSGPDQDASVAVFGDLRQLSVRGADLSFRDAGSGLDLALPSADLSLRQEPDGVTLRLSTRLRIGQSEAALGIAARYRDDISPIAVAVNFAEVDIAGLTAAIGSPRLEQIRGLQLVAAGRLDIALLPDGIIDRLDFDVTTGPGQISLPRLWATEFPVFAMAAKGQFVNNLAHLNMADLDLDLGDGLIANASGQWNNGSEGMTLQAKGQFHNLSAEKLQLLWPEGLGVTARTWVLGNVQGGIVPKGSFSLDLRPGDMRKPGLGTEPRAGMVRLDWLFQDLTAKIFGAMPAVQMARGSGHVDGREFGLKLASATVGGLQLSEGSLHVADFGDKAPILDVEFVAHGAVRQALALLDSKPFEFSQALGLRPEEAAGNSATRARLRVPLRDDLGLAQIGFSAAVNVADLALARLPGGYTLHDGAFTLMAEQSGLQLSGRGSVNGVPLNLSWKREFQPARDAPGDHLTVHGKMTPAHMQALGMPPLPRLRGVVDMAVSIDAYDDGTRRGAGRFDLTAAAVDLNEIGWRKPNAAPATMNLTFQTGANGEIQIDHWDILAGGLAARGSAKLDPQASLVSLRSDNFTLGATTLAVDLRALFHGGYRLDLKGPSLDARAFMPHWQGVTATAEEPSLELYIDIDRVLLTDSIAIGRLNGTGQRRGGNWLTANMRGVMSGGQPVGFTVRREAKGRRFIVVAGDAGGMARALGLYANARGGGMYLSFLVPDQSGTGDAIAGQFRANNFHVVKAPVLTQLLTLGSLRGLGDLLNDKGISFTRLDIPFTLLGNQLHIERARAVGPAMALIATGDYGRGDQGMRFHGTIVPSYTINSVLGAIPILGNLLIGREGEGVFAFTYKVTGNLAKPKVSVNLLSALAPGFLRRIVEGLEQPAVDPPGQNLGNVSR